MSVPLELIQVNGTTTTDFRDAKRLFSSGHIALQSHRGETRVEFRNIEIQELALESRD